LVLLTASRLLPRFHGIGLICIKVLLQMIYDVSRALADSVEKLKDKLASIPEYGKTTKTAIWLRFHDLGSCSVNLNTYNHLFFIECD
jgi:hypothetical protein